MKVVLITSLLTASLVATLVGHPYFLFFCIFFFAIVILYFLTCFSSCLHSTKLPQGSHSECGVYVYFPPCILIIPLLYFVSCISISLHKTKYHLKLPQGNECGQSECGIYPTCQKTGQWEILEDCRRWNFFSAVSTYFSSGTSPALETLTLANFCKRTLNVQGTWSLPTSEEIWSIWAHPPHQVRDPGWTWDGGMCRLRPSYSL